MKAGISIKQHFQNKAEPSMKTNKLIGTKRKKYINLPGQPFRSRFPRWRCAISAFCPRSCPEAKK